MEKTFEKQGLQVEEKQKQLDERLGSLKELFGHLTSTAGDLRTNLSGSIVSASTWSCAVPERADRENEQRTQLPTIAEIERLWYEQQREIVESGKVVKFSGVVKPDGNEHTQDVVRVGNYGLISMGKYVQYKAANESMAELPRQMSEHTGSAAALESATSGFTRTGIDPTGPIGGHLMLAMMDSPTLEERWHQGGLVGYAHSV